MYEGVWNKYIKGHNHHKSLSRYVVDPITDCWIWQGARCGPKPHGEYSQTRRNGKKLPAHIVYYEEKYGPVPEGLQLDHYVCENKLCVNPDHVKPVTAQVNSQRKRNIVLTPQDVYTIKYKLNNVNLTEIAEQFGISISAVSRIRSNKTWSNI